MKSGHKVLVFVAVVMVVCCAVAYLVADWVSQTQSWQHDQEHGHEWLRQETGLNDAEFAAIDAFEAGYREQRAELLAKYREQMGSLRDLLVERDDFTPEVQHAIHDLHLVHGELQELSIRHYYDMLSVLPPEKKDRLRNVAADALSEPE